MPKSRQLSGCSIASVQKLFFKNLHIETGLCGWLRMNPLPVLSPLKWMHFVIVGRPSQEEKEEGAWNSFAFMFSRGQTDSPPGANSSAQFSSSSAPLFWVWHCRWQPHAPSRDWGLDWSHDQLTFKSHALGCWPVVPCVRTVAVFVKVMAISDGQSLSNICMACFPAFWGFLSNNTGNSTSE